MNSILDKELLFGGIVCFFTGFDIIFYRAWNDAQWPIWTYRIFQSTVGVGLYRFAIAIVGDHSVALACFSFWFLLGCDVLYYWGLGLKVEPFSWFRTSPVVFYFMTIKKQPAAPADAVLISAGVGLALAQFILLW